ncbi:putative transglutaminase-like protease [Methanococcus maripaludis]|uniref:Putative transglutaminase-like protease n=1 Tax=Methanococcus maripaludis TaxID=39152 RepID=A0A7J9P2X4_METMI|nr:transglutaminase-like domain-containing protein [Methanococcus maripaludis]MBA2853743.1 putative transglutaminase-like protease [Methanococcus maripaludis]
MFKKIIDYLAIFFAKYIGTRSLKRQSCPSNKDLENIRVLLNQLKGKYDHETIVNILEWQARNIEYWYERADLFLLLLFIVLLGYGFISVTKTLSLGVPYGQWSNLVLVLFLVFWYSFKDQIGHLNSYLLSLSLLALIIYSMFNESFWMIFLGILIGSFITIPLIMYLKYSHYNGKYGKLSGKWDIFKLILLTITPNLSTNEMRAMDWAICRDYAKLSSAMLLHIYPEVYFLTISGHVALAIRIDDKYYVLDQQLPLIRADNWLEKFNKKSADVYKITRKNSEIILEYLEKLPDYVYSNEPVSEKDMIQEEKIISDLEKSLKIEFSGEKSNKVLEINDLPKNLAKYYDENTHLSIIRLMRNRIDSELGMNVENITNIDLELDNEDIKLKIYLK